jgi:hypothetical protein
MPDISAPKMNVKTQIYSIVRDAISKTAHDITTHKGLNDFKKELTPQILGGFPQEERDKVAKLIDEAITSHGEFHDINREKAEGEMKKGKKAQS